MGPTPLPAIPPGREYLPNDDGELVEVTGFSPSISRGRTVQHAPPFKADVWWNLLQFVPVLAILGLIVFLVLRVAL